MVLLMAFIVTVLVGDVIAVGIAELIELFSEKIGLFVFLALYVGDPGGLAHRGALYRTEEGRCHAAVAVTRINPR